MSDGLDPLTLRARDRVPMRPPASAADPVIDPGVFRNDFGEELTAILDLDSWRSARDLDEEYGRVEEEIRQSVEAETEHQTYIRREVHPLIAEAPFAPPGAGRHSVELAEIAEVHRGLLFNGAVECCDGTSQSHDTLALTIYQLGVSLVSYRGDQGCWQQRLFRRDLELRAEDPVAAVMELLERRGKRGGLHDTDRDNLSDLARRGLMSYAERAVLTLKSQAPWRMGHGSPAPLELIGAQFTDLVIQSIRVIRQLIDHQRFIFIASEPSDRPLLTIGQGLHPLEYVIVGTMQERIAPYLEEWKPGHPPTIDATWDGTTLKPEEWVSRFLDEVAPKVVYGLYRATMLAPPQLFYAHVDHSHVAARIALADSVLLEQRGFPLLIDLADRVCKSIYGGGSLQDLAATAYAAAGAPFRYGSERNTRDP